MARQRPTATTEPRQIPPRGGSQAREGEFGKAFHHLCHLVALSRTGKMKSAVENLVNTTIGLCSDRPLTSPDGVVEAVQVFFGIDVLRPGPNRASCGSAASPSCGRDQFGQCVRRRRAQLAPPVAVVACRATSGATALGSGAR